jgi:branched-chain amino acid transport system substrate-binding protein
LLCIFSYFSGKRKKTKLYIRYNFIIKGGIMKKLLAVALSALTLFSLAACSGQPSAGGGEGGGAEGDTIRIGVFEPLTGANASGGELEVQGIELAHEQFPEVLGKKIELVKIDNKSDPVEAATAAARLVENEGVDIVLGSWGSTLSLAGGDTFKNNKIVAIGASCTNPNVTLGNDYYYRVCFLDPFQGTVLANYAYNTLGARKVAVIFEASNDYAVGLRQFFIDAFEALGGQITSSATYQTGDQDFNSHILTAMNDSPEVIFAPGNYTEGALIQKQARQAGYADVKFLGGDTYEVQSLIDVGGADVEGCIITTFFDPAAPLNSTTTSFVESYRAKYSAEPAAFTALGYDAYITAYKAIEAAGSTDSEAIRAALGTLTVAGATGDIKFDQNGDAIKNMAVLKVVKDGKFEFLDTVTIE